MRILKVSQSYYPFLEAGGPPVKVRAIACKLAQRGHHVTILTADLGLERHNAALEDLERSRWGWRGKNGGVETIYLRSLARYRTLTFNPDVMGFCRASLDSFDLVHIYGLYDLLGPTVSYFCREQSIPYVVEPMGMYRPMDRSFLLKRFWHWGFGDRCCRSAARMIATSPMEQQELIEDGVPTERIVVRYNGIDEAAVMDLPPRGSFRKKWGILEDEPLILFLGRLIPRKGADLLIQAFVEACPSTSRLVIAGPEGEAGYLATLKRLAEEQGVEDRILFTGPLYGSEKKAVLADAEVFVLPSRYENFANAVAEAIACSIPVIVTQSCGIWPLVSGRAGIVIAPERKSLAAALRELLQNQTLYSSLRQGCRQVAESLDWTRLTAQMEDCYATVLGG